MRQPVPDLLKGVAVIAMIQVHVMEQFARPEIFNGPPGKVSLFLGGPFAAPVFMAVMGYFLGKARPGGREAEKNKIWMKFRRGGALILLGLLLNIGLNFTLLVNIFRGKFEADPFQYIFGADILPLAGLSILIIGLMEVLLKKRGIAALILAAAIPAITPFITGLPEQYKYVQAFIGSPEKWSYFPLFPWLAYPLLGYGWRRFELEYPSMYDFIVKNLKIVLIISVALVLALAMPAYRNVTELGAYYHHGILLFCWMAGL